MVVNTWLELEASDWWYIHELCRLSEEGLGCCNVGHVCQKPNSPSGQHQRGIQLWLVLTVNTVRGILYTIG